jgi:drug/metabolite transporter (DMT)-like permease
LRFPLGVTWAEKYIASGFAALLIATEPFWVVLLNWAISHRRPNGKILFGVLIGHAGVALLGEGLGHSGASLSMEFIGSGVVMLASVAWAVGSVYSNRHPIKTSTWMASGMQMLASGSLLLLLGLFTGEFHELNLAKASWTSVVALGYLTIFGSLVAFTAYSWLFRNDTPARAATYAYVNPVVAVLLGWLIASEPITLRIIIAAAIIVGSLVLITTYGREQLPRHVLSWRFQLEWLRKLTPPEIGKPSNRESRNPLPVESCYLQANTSRTYAPDAQSSKSHSSH